MVTASLQNHKNQEQRMEFPSAPLEQCLNSQLHKHRSTTTVWRFTEHKRTTGTKSLSQRRGGVSSWWGPQLSIIWDSSCNSSSSAMSVSTSPCTRWSSANSLISSSKSSMAEVETARGAVRLILRVLEGGGVC